MLRSTFSFLVIQIHVSVSRSYISISTLYRQIIAWVETANSFLLSPLRCWCLIFLLWYFFYFFHVLWWCLTPSFCLSTSKSYFFWIVLLMFQNFFVWVVKTNNLWYEEMKLILLMFNVFSTIRYTFEDVLKTLDLCALKVSSIWYEEMEVKLWLKFDEFNV